MFRTIFASLRVRLILLTLVVLVPALGLLIYVADQDRQNALDEVKSKALYLARLAAAEELQVIQSTHQLLQTLAQTPEAHSETSKSACDAMVAQQIKLHPHYDNLGVIGPKGMRFCSVLLPEQSVDLSNEPISNARSKRATSSAITRLAARAMRESVSVAVLDASGTPGVLHR
jgi:hypothetical protein